MKRWAISPSSAKVLLAQVGLWVGLFTGLLGIGC
jgi:hypothetical protein